MGLDRDIKNMPCRSQCGDLVPLFCAGLLMAIKSQPWRMDASKSSAKFRPCEMPGTLPSVTLLDHSRGVVTGQESGERSCVAARTSFKPRTESKHLVNVANPVVRRYLYSNQLNVMPSTSVFQGLDSLWLL